MSESRTALEAAGRQDLDRLVRSLSRRSPGEPTARIEEAVQEAFADACMPERETWFAGGFAEGFAEGGRDELYGRLFSASWRKARGETRKLGHKRTARLPTGADMADPMQAASVGAAVAELNA